MSNHMKVDISEYRAMQAKVKSLEARLPNLEAEIEELNRQVRLAVDKYLEADAECMALRRECARRS